jgi:hypothetical protein
MIVDVNAGWKAHSLLRHSTKTQNTGNFEEANRFITLVREYTNRDALIRHRMQKESILSGALHCATRPQPLYFLTNTPFQYFPMPFP